VSAALFAGTVTAGLVLRMVPLGLPGFVVKYGGSMLWAVMIYWVVSAVLARWRPMMAGLVAGSIATAVEFFKRYHSPGTDAFRTTLPGVLLLSRYFSVRDIAAYWTAIVVAAVVDATMLRRDD
jgi:hypothetical protein